MKVNRLKRLSKYISIISEISFNFGISDIRFKPKYSKNLEVVLYKRGLPGPTSLLKNSSLPILLLIAVIFDIPPIFKIPIGKVIFFFETTN